MEIEAQSSMEKSWFNLMFSKGELGYRCELSKSMDSFAPIEKTPISQDRVISDTGRNLDGWGKRSSYSKNLNFLVSSKGIYNFISKAAFFVRDRIRDRNRNSSVIYFDIKKKKLEIDLKNLKFFFYSSRSYGCLSNRSKSYNNDPYIKDTKYNRYYNNYIISCIDSYFRSHIDIYSRNNNNYYERYIYNCICSQSGKISKRKNYKKKTNMNRSNLMSSMDFYRSHYLWIQCENCYEVVYTKVLKSTMNVCKQCGYYMKMSSSDRIELSIDRGTWNPMDENVFSGDPLKFGETYKKRIRSAQKRTGLTEAVQTGTGQLNGIPVALGVMDFHFLGGSLGCAVGEKISRLIDYATKKTLPLILVCSSGGARMQEGSLGLIQMAKICSVLAAYQSKKKLLYISILTSPTTGGVTASFGMLGDIIIAEPHAYIAFAGKRVIEQTLKKPLSDDKQEAEALLRNGLLDTIVPRNLLKNVLSELLKLHAFFPLNKNSIKYK